MPESAQNVTKGEVAESKPKPRCTEAEKLRRIDQVVQWLSEGWPRRMIHNEMRQKWGLAQHTCDLYMAAARKELVALFNENREEFVAQQLAALEDLAYKATKGKQYTAASGARATMAKLTGTSTPAVGAAAREANTARKEARLAAEAAAAQED